MQTDKSLKFYWKINHRNGQVLKNANIVVDSCKITEISTDGLIDEYQDRIDLGDRKVLPGLIDTHIHIKYTGKPEPVEHSDKYLAK
jgi:imidazolonepropionase-like amidohydrolase